MRNDIRENGAAIREQRAKERAERGEGHLGDQLADPSGLIQVKEARLQERRYQTEDGMYFYNTQDLPKHGDRKPMIKMNIRALLGKFVNVYLFYEYSDCSLFYLENCGCPAPDKKDEVPWKKMTPLLIYAKVTLYNWPITVRMPFDPRNTKGTFSGLNDPEYRRLADALEKTPVSEALRGKLWPSSKLSIIKCIFWKWIGKIPCVPDTPQVLDNL